MTLKTTAQLLEIGDCIVGSKDENFTILDIDYLPNNDIILYAKTANGSGDEIRMRTRPGSPFTVRLT